MPDNKGKEIGIAERLIAPDAIRIFKEAKVEVIENAEGLVADHITFSPGTVLK